MKTKTNTVLTKIGSGLLIYGAIALGYWQSWAPGMGHQRFYGEPWVQPGVSLMAITAGMLTAGIGLFIVSDGKRHLGAFAAGLLALSFMLGMMPLDEGYFAGVLLLELLGLPHTLVLGFFKVIAGIVLPIRLVETAGLLFQAVLTLFYFKRAKKIRWGFITVKLAVLCAYGLFLLYPNLSGEWALSLFDLLNLIWLAETPWIWLDFSSSPKS